MEFFKIGRKIFEVKENISEKRFHVVFKGKSYCLIKFSSYTAFSYYLDEVKKLLNAGIRHPKIKLKDKKQFIVVENMVFGENIRDLLMKSDLDDNIYSQIFLQNYMCKLSKINIDFEPHNFILGSDGVLYYISSFSEGFDDEKAFVKEKIRLWFYTKEFIRYLEKEDLPSDKTRLKEDFVINKEIVLKTVKYYR